MKIRRDQVGEKGYVHSVYIITTVIQHLPWRSGGGGCPSPHMRGGKYMIQNISLVSASNCTELSFAVDLKDRLL